MKSRNAVLSIVVLLISVGSHQSAKAAQIACADTFVAENFKGDIRDFYPSGREPTQSSCLSILIRGEIELGDSNKFLQILRRNHPFVNSVFLISQGGSVEESIKIGRLIRRYLLATFAPVQFVFGQPSEGKFPINNLPPFATCTGGGCNCASSCFLIWSAGAARHGNTIGVHRPTNHSSTFSSLPPDQSAKIYRQQLAEIKLYLGEMEVPQKYIDMMTSTASNDIYWLSQDEGDAMNDMPPSISESMSASCGALDKNEEKVLREIFLSKQQPLSDRAEIVREKYFGMLTCDARKLANYRDSIASVETE